MMRLGRFSFFAACLLLAMRCQQHHMPHDSLNMPYKTSNIAACLGTRSARSQFQHIIIGSSQLGPVTRLLHAPDVAADLLRALSRGFAQMSIQQSGLISYDFVTNERMRAVVITKGKSFSLGWNKACTSRLVNGNTQPSAPSTGSINPF